MRLANKIAGRMLKALRLDEVTSFRGLERLFPLFHLSWTKPDYHHEDNRVIFRPRVPDTTWMDINGDVIEDNFTPRVSLSKSIEGAQSAVERGEGRPYVYAVTHEEASRVQLLDVSEKVRQCHDRLARGTDQQYGPDFTFMTFLNEHTEYMPDTRDAISGPADLTEEGRQLWKGCVPDANQTQEVWALEPVELVFLGRIDGDQVIPLH